MKKGAAKADPKKKDKKKLTPAEQAKLEEEAKARLALRIEEQKKFGITMEAEGLPFLLSQSFLEEAWCSENPKETAQKYLNEQFRRLKIFHKIKPSEVRLFANQILFDMIFLKKDLGMSFDKIYPLANLLFKNFINKDERFNIDYPIVKEIDPAAHHLEEEEEEPTETVTDPLSTIVLDDGEEIDDYRAKLDPSESLANKSYDSDLVEFKLSLAKIIKKRGETLANKEQITKLVSYAMSSYFGNWHLFRFTSAHQPTEELVTLQISIDEPTLVAPLEQALMVAKGQDSSEDETKQGELIEEAVDPEGDQPSAPEAAEDPEALAQSELLQAQARKREEWLGLDEKTIAIIEERLEKTRKYMLEKIESKKEEYTEKLTASKISLKKK